MNRGKMIMDLVMLGWEVVGVKGGSSIVQKGNVRGRIAPFTERSFDVLVDLDDINGKIPDHIKITAYKNAE